MPIVNVSIIMSPLTVASLSEAQLGNIEAGNKLLVAMEVWLMVAMEVGHELIVTMEVELEMIVTMEVGHELLTITVTFEVLVIVTVGKLNTNKK